MVKDRVVARYIFSKVKPLTIDQNRLRKWFTHLLHDEKDKIVDDVIVTPSGSDEMIVHVNSQKQGHLAYRLKFEIRADLNAIRISPKITPI